jgi:hypothetical protein
LLSDSPYNQGSCFETLGLSELPENQLLSRFDRKYLIPLSLIDSVLELAKSDYRLLKIGDKTEHRYISTYFDTADYNLYLKHHNKRKLRFKIRTREYLDSQIRFAELKIKGKNGQTEKYRKSLSIADSGENEITQLLISNAQEFGKMQPTIAISYTRKTLFHKNIDQRVTIDTKICFSENGIEKWIPNMAILEVKYSGAKQNSKTSFTQLIHKFERNFSKYCIGVALLHPEIKHNNFLFTLKKIIRLENVDTQFTTNNQNI